MWLLLFKNKKIIALLAAFAALGLVGVYSYTKGKQAARLKCEREAIQVQAQLNNVIAQASEENQKLAKELAARLEELEKAKSSRVRKVIKYVEKLPDANTPVFDSTGLSILNAAQANKLTKGK